MQQPVQRVHQVCGAEAGATLVELFIGIVVVVTVLGAVLHLSVDHSKQRMLNREMQLAFSACRDNLEEVRSMSFEDVAALDNVGFDVQSDNGAPAGLRPVPGDPDGLPGRFIVTVDKTVGAVTQYAVVAEVVWVGTRRNRFALSCLVGRRK